MTATSLPINKCQTCSSKNLVSVLFVGYIPPVNTMRNVDSAPVEETAYPLEMLRCYDCGLVQIGLEVLPEVLFPESYPYLSGSTRILRSNFADLCAESENLLDLSKDRLVIDIGSNDGTLLSNFYEAGYPVLGIEPSQAADVALGRGINTLKTYFSPNTAKKVISEFGNAQLITAANVFAHISDVHSVVSSIVEILDKKGVFISESHYLLDLVETIQYDTIYHEHLRYYSLGSLQYLLAAHGLEVFHIKRIPTHGGSIRVYASRKGQHNVLPSVNLLLAEEGRRGITDGSGLKDFSQRVIRSKSNLYELIAPLKRGGARIFGIGAPSRASTLIKYVGIDDGILDAIMEVSSSHKLNKYVPGTRIPVLDEALLFKEQPEYVLLLSWHIAEELMVNLRKGGYKGKFIIPLPEPRIIN